MSSDIEIEPPELTPEELQIQTFALNSLASEVAERQELTPFLLQSMRLTRGDDGELRDMTEDEFFDSLPEQEQANYQNLQLQLDRQKMALEGTLPISEGLRQRQEADFRAFRQVSAESGNRIRGDTLQRAVGTTTPGIQGLKAFRDTQRLLQDTERRAEIQTGQANIQSQLGLMTDLRTRRIDEATVFPQRHLAAINPFVSQQGILNNRSLANAQLRARSDQDFWSGIGNVGGILGNIIGAIP